MARKTEVPGPPPLTQKAARAAVQSGRIAARFQPIEALQTGECKGFEALARLDLEGTLIPPDLFLPLLGLDDLLCLFGTMLGEAIRLFKGQGSDRGDLYVSINVEISLLVSADFIDVLQYFLERYDFKGEQLVLEILENEDMTDLARLSAAIDAVRELGLSVALDDIGSAYASLTKIKALPIDIVKLDRSFSRDLERQPEDLMFVMSMLSLARGLGKRMVVEGIETPEVYDALRIIGVELGQGYAITRPMPAHEVSAWLAGRVLRGPDLVPRSLLGAYASHMMVVETCRILRRQPLPIAWTPAASDHRSCVVGRLFGARGWHATTFGIAHRQFHAVLGLYEDDPEAWLEGADRFRRAMAAHIGTPMARLYCEPVSTKTEAIDGCFQKARRPAVPPRKRRRVAA